jgi:hypothetical protein
MCIFASQTNNTPPTRPTWLQRFTGGAILACIQAVFATENARSGTRIDTITTRFWQGHFQAAVAKQPYKQFIRGKPYKQNKPYIFQRFLVKYLL